MTGPYRIALPYVQLADPHLCTDSHAVLCIRRLLFPGLLTHTGKRPYGLLSDRWNVEDGGRIWYFHLRDGCRFPNGRNPAAADVVYSLRRAVSPSTGGQLYTVPYREYIGDAEFEIIDRSTVRIINPDPVAYLPELLPDLAILPEGWSGYTDGTGAGPYELAEQDEDRVRLKLRREASDGAAPVSSAGSLPDLIEFTAIPEKEDRLAALRKGDVDGILDAVIAEHAGLTTAGWDTSLSVIFLIECGRPPLDNPQVRQALNYAVDKDRLVREIVHGLAYPLNGPFSNRHFAHDPSISPYPHDPQRARRLLEEAGMVRSPGTSAGGVVEPGTAMHQDFRLHIHAPTAIPDEGPALAEFLAGAYRDIGLRVEVHLHEDRAEYARQVAEKELHGIFCFDSSPLSSFKVLHEKIDSRRAGTWWQGYRSDEVNRLISRAASTPDDTERAGIYQQAYRILHEEAPWVFLYQPRRFWLFNTSSRPALPVDDLGHFKAPLPGAG
ncbi:MAG: ABC transporter substrate-binding protein [Sediminispirochaetaceae bacterium]